MKKPYIFGHRGAMGYEIQNTINSFERAVEMGAGIETDVHLTKDKELICFHDPGFKLNGKPYIISQLTESEVKALPFKDGREIPALREVFDYFKDMNGKIRYSCDIGNRKVGAELIKLVDQYDLFDHLEITDIREWTLFSLRKKSKKIKLVHTIPYQISKINQNTVNFDKLREYGVDTVNIKQNRAKDNNLKEVVDNGFKYYVWGVNSTVRMKRVMKFKYKDEHVRAIYTNYPDLCFEIREKYFCE